LPISSEPPLIVTASGIPLRSSPGRPSRRVGDFRGPRPATALIAYRSLTDLGLHRLAEARCSVGPFRSRPPPRKALGTNAGQWGPATPGPSAWSLAAQRWRALVVEQEPAAELSPFSSPDAVQTEW